MDIHETITSQIHDTGRVSGFLDRLFEVHGYDFRGYRRATVRRRLGALMHQTRITTLKRLERLMAMDATMVDRLVDKISIPITEMFRDPLVFKSIRHRVLPILASYPHIRIWAAGTATGEEAYSVAIMLREEGLYSRSLIYATDISARNLARASRPRIPVAAMAKNTSNYYRAGGLEEFSRYYRLQGNHSILDPALRERIVFASHNLVTDGCFGHFHLVLCRNVLIYFEPDFLDRVIELLGASVIDRGFLCIGAREHLGAIGHRAGFAGFHSRHRIFRRGSPTASQALAA